MINGLKLQGTEYKDARILFYGAGSSAVGVALAIETMMQTNGGLSKEEAQQVCYRLQARCCAGHCASQPLGLCCLSALCRGPMWHATLQDRPCTACVSAQPVRVY